MIFYIGPYTHVCGILAGNGAASNGKYKGVAPECTLLCGKVLDQKGAGSLQNLLAGLEWVIELKKDFPIRILNISIEMEQTTNLDPEEVSYMQHFMEFLWKENVIIVAAAGNKGPGPMSISPIGEAGNCICVGCHDGDYTGAGGRTCAEYSGRGPGKAQEEISLMRNPLKKPDLVAPGTDIVSCSNKAFRRNHVWHHAYIAKSGTSMATPLVSGACALCLQKYPEITNKQVQRNLLRTAKDLGENWNAQGAGMLQVTKLLENVMK